LKFGAIFYLNRDREMKMDGIQSAFESITSNNTIIGVVAGFLGKILLDRLTQANKRDIDVDLDMRKRRLDVYAELWTATALLPKWPRNENLTFEQLQELQTTLKNWYFNKGGIYLSRSTFDHAYTPLQDKLTDIAKFGLKGPVPLAQSLATDQRDAYEEVSSACSNLRTSLTRDVQSRREAPFWSFNF
jgi:hypothetical protein